MSRGFALAFFELRANAVLLQFGQIVDEDLAVQVVHLVLDAGGEHPRRVEREASAVAVEGGDGNAFRPLDVIVDPGHGETALLVDRDALAARDLGINEHPQVFLSSLTSITSICLCTSTWVAASPTPGAAYMVSARSSISLRVAASSFSTRRAGVLRRGSGY